MPTTRRLMVGTSLRSFAHPTICMIVLLIMTACSSDGTVYAPVTDGTTIESIPSQGTYRVMPGDTLYSIAWRYGFDYRVLARNNGLSSPYSIRTGQIIYLKKRAGSTAMKTVVPVTREPVVSVSQWQWPAVGPIVGKFSELNKGINIAGHVGDAVYTTAAGKVVYSGNGLRGYGNLIIIKHNSTYLTAYAHNELNYVQAGDWVKSGQKIAKMGDTGAQRVMLHFEIRRNGKPEDPLSYLSR